MMLKSHLAIAAGGYAVALDILSNNFEHIAVTHLYGAILTLIGAVMPDIDHPGSFIGRRLKFISVPISAVFGHRGITHSLIPLVAVWFVFSDSIPYWTLWLSFGYLMHLVGDYLTEGVPLLWPLTNNRFKFLLVTKTNSAGEPILVTLFLAICTLWIIYD